MPAAPIVTVAPATLVTMPPLIASELLVAFAELPTLIALFSMFHVVPTCTATVLLEPPPAPTVSPPLNSVALVAVMAS